MYPRLGTWVIAIFSILSTAQTSAMKWVNEEQFVEGEFPYFPFSSKLYSLSDGMTDDEALANENSAIYVDKKTEIVKNGRKADESSIGKRSLGRSHKSTFYEFKNDSDSVIDATKFEVNNDNGGSKKTLSKIGRLVFKNSKESSKKSQTDASRPIRSNVYSKPEIQIGYEEQKTQFLDDGLSPQSSDISDRVLQNLSGPMSVEAKPRGAQVREGLEGLLGSKCGESNSKSGAPSVKINPPYENNFSGGGFRHTNPSTWLAREIEKFIRRKDYRWLDFMKNNGLETNGVLVETKHPEERKHFPKNRVIECLKQYDNAVDRTSLESKDKGDPPQQNLLHQIDTLLEDLSEFRANVKNDKMTDKKQRHVKPLDQGEIVREVRSVTLPNLRGKLEHQKTIGRHPTSSLVLDDLNDLKKNIVLYENNLIDDENRQALEDLRLHIKVYVENGDKPSSDEENK